MSTTDKQNELMQAPTTNNELIGAIRALVDQLSKPRAAIPFDKLLWDDTACAEYLVMSVSHFSQRVAALPDFPRPIDVSTTGRRRSARWKAQEVVRWAEHRQERKRA